MLVKRRRKFHTHNSKWKKDSKQPVSRYTYPKATPQRGDTKLSQVEEIERKCEEGESCTENDDEQADLNNDPGENESEEEMVPPSPSICLGTDIPREVTLAKQEFTIPEELQMRGYEFVDASKLRSIIYDYGILIKSDNEQNQL